MNSQASDQKIQFYGHYVCSKPKTQPSDKLNNNCSLPLESFHNSNLNFESNAFQAPSLENQMLNLNLEQNIKGQENHNFTMNNAIIESAANEFHVVLDQEMIEQPLSMIDNAANATLFQPHINVEMTFSQENLPLSLPKKVDNNEYLNEAYQNFCTETKKFFKPCTYMEFQNDINANMRGILVDWLAEIAFQLKLLDETLFTAVAIVDSFLCKSEVKKANLQLIGATAILISSKIHEVISLRVKDVAYLTDFSSSISQIIETEKIILFALSFCVNLPTQLSYFEIYSLKLQLNHEEILFGHFLLEMSLLDYKLLRFNPIMIANCIVLLVLLKFDKTGEPLTTLSNEEMQELEQCTTILSQIVSKPPKKCKAVQQKYFHLISSSII